MKLQISISNSRTYFETLINQKANVGELKEQIALHISNNPLLRNNLNLAQDFILKKDMFKLLPVGNLIFNNENISLENLGIKSNMHIKILLSSDKIKFSSNPIKSTKNECLMM